MILVGHGVGAWISFVVAERKPFMVGGIVGMAADPDFTEELLWKKLSDDIKEKIMKDGVCDIQWGNENYPISRNLIEDGRQNLLLNKATLPIKCPVRLIHGLSDEEVPYMLALQLAENCITNDASVVLMKGSTHSMESESDMRMMRDMVEEIIDTPRGFDLRSPASG